MKYFVTLAGRTHEVELSAEGLRLDGRPLKAELARVGGGAVRHLLLETRSVLFSGRRTEAGWTIELGGRRLTVAVEDERARAVRELAGTPDPAAGGRSLRAPMPGLVVRVLVEPGQEVEAGTPLVVVEAMKMENELRAEAGGRVTEVPVEEGQTVNQDDLLVAFEP